MLFFVELAIAVVVLWLVGLLIKKTFWPNKENIHIEK